MSSKGIEIKRKYKRAVLEIERAYKSRTKRARTEFRKAIEDSRYEKKVGIFHAKAEFQRALRELSNP
ncbi:MAG TPA: hypothetical protein VMU16_15290 [Candidatus Binataceae bacterium]|nr:hypothetical protein [Candidatus Binataceae bacterium]